jgi:excisionase family DNA binding protein
MTMTSELELLTVEEAATILRLSPATLNKWRSLHNSGPKFTRVGRRVLYPRQALEDFVRRNVFDSTSAYGLHNA